MNPDTRTERNGVPITIYDEPESFTGATGSYKHGQPGMALTLNYDYVGEVPREAIEEELEALLDAVYARTNSAVEAHNEEVSQ